MRLRWRDLDLPIMDPPEIVRRARMAEHPLIGGETEQEYVGEEARTIAARVVLSGPYREMIQDLDATIAPGSEGVLEYPSLGRIDVVVRSCVVVRHGDGSADYRIEWAYIQPSNTAYMVIRTSDASRLDAYRQNIEESIEAAAKMANSADVVASIEMVTGFVSTTKRWASLAGPGSIGRLLQAASNLEAAAQSVIREPLRVLAAWRDCLAIMPVRVLDLGWSDLLGARPADSGVITDRIWSAMTIEYAIAYAEASLADTPEIIARASNALEIASGYVFGGEDAWEALNRYQIGWSKRAKIASVRKEYIAEYGDSVITLADRSGIPIEDALSRLNPDDPCWLAPGETMYV